MRRCGLRDSGGRPQRARHQASERITPLLFWRGVAARRVTGCSRCLRRVQPGAKRAGARVELATRFAWSCGGRSAWPRCRQRIEAMRVAGRKFSAFRQLSFSGLTLAPPTLAPPRRALRPEQFHWLERERHIRRQTSKAEFCTKISIHSYLHPMSLFPHSVYRSDYPPETAVKSFALACRIRAELKSY